MINQKVRFTNAMRHASNPNNPPGGSVAIQGKPGNARQSKAVQFIQANMMRSATDPDDCHASSSASSSATAATPHTWGQGPEHPPVHLPQCGRDSRGEMAATTSRDLNLNQNVGAMRADHHLQMNRQRLLTIICQHLKTTGMPTGAASRFQRLAQPSPRRQYRSLSLPMRLLCNRHKPTGPKPLNS